jgi:hypothetical protein
MTVPIHVFFYRFASIGRLLCLCMVAECLVLDRRRGINVTAEHCAIAGDTVGCESSLYEPDLRRVDLVPLFF